MTNHSTTHQPYGSYRQNWMKQFVIGLVAFVAGALLMAILNTYTPVTVTLPTATNSELAVSPVEEAVRFNGMRVSSAPVELTLSPVEEAVRFNGMRVASAPIELTLSPVEEAVRFDGMRVSGIQTNLMVSPVEETVRFNGMRISAAPASLALSPVEEAQRFTREWYRLVQAQAQR